MQIQLKLSPRSRRDMVPWVALGAIACLWGIGFLMVPASAGAVLPGIRLPACPLRSLTGLRCPFCGMTTGCAWMTRGQFLAAWNSNILSPWVMLGALASAIYLAVFRLGAGYKVTLWLSAGWVAWIRRIAAGSILVSWITNLVRG